VHFVIKYASLSQPDVWRTYGCAFDLVDYTTLFKLQAQLEPNELCRLRTVCNMNLKITKVHENPYTDLMYEVLNDQNLWAVCGRSAGKLDSLYYSLSFFAYDLILFLYTRFTFAF